MWEHSDIRYLHDLPSPQKLSLQYTVCFLMMSFSVERLHREYTQIKQKVMFVEQ